MNKKEYIITDSLELLEIATGKIQLKLGNVYELIDKVFDSKGKLLAIKRDNKLVKYNVFHDDKDLAYLKTVNKLFTYDEMIQNFRKLGIVHGTFDIMYKKIKSEQLNLYFAKKTYETYYADYHALVLGHKITEHGSRYKTSERKNITIKIYRYTVDKKRDLFLYRYFITPFLL